MLSGAPFGGGGGRPEGGVAPLPQGAQGSDGAADQSVVPDLLLLRTAHRLLAQDHSRRHVSIALLELQSHKYKSLFHRPELLWTPRESFNY